MLDRNSKLDPGTYFAFWHLSRVSKLKRPSIVDGNGRTFMLRRRAETTRRSRLGRNDYMDIGVFTLHYSKDI
jgi:hypothetical protein